MQTWRRRNRPLTTNLLVLHLSHPRLDVGRAMSKKYLIFGCVIVLTGCGSYVPTVDLGELSAAQRHKINSVEIVDAQMLSRTNYKILNFAEGHSCQNKMWDPPATRVAAVQQLKYFAWEMGGERYFGHQVRRSGGDIHTYELLGTNILHRQRPTCDNPRRLSGPSQKRWG